MAGIQADKSICEHYAVKGHVVTTSVTIQGANHFYNRFDQDSNFITDSVLNILENNQIDFVKIGMLANLQITQAIFNIFKNRQIKLILDPVFRSTSGGELLDVPAIDFLKTSLLPMCYVITPNTNEAELLTGKKVADLDGMVESAEAISRLGAANIIVKGGHLDNLEYATDVLYEEGGRVFMERARRVNNNVRGSGCRFAASIACNLALQNSLKRSFVISKKLVTSLYNK